MRNPSRHAEWLSFIEVSGPFLAVSVLEQAFPQGLDVVDTPRRQRFRAAYEEWRDAVDEGDPLLPDLHREWIRLVFTEILEYDDESLKTDAEAVAPYTVVSPERTETFSPNWIVRSPSDGNPRLFISIQNPGTDLDKVRRDDMWPASLSERMAALCRMHGVRLGLATDGERWMLVDAPLNAPSSVATWAAHWWFQEPVTLKAFQSLLGVRRCFGPADETLEALLEKSLEHQEEVTDTLGEQVRRAVEVLIQCLDKADADRNRELLREVLPTELYEAGLTVMMRLVFVLCAEERGLLLCGDPVYDECYAVSTLRAQLAEEADRYGPEVLERRYDAWARLLAIFRAIYGGIDHEALRMPAMGGSLFDPDRFAFLEGRAKGTSWRDSDAAPLPIDNRTVLLLLSSLQLLEQRGGALLLSYRALDIEQIGHVYEGLLEHTVARVPSVTAGLLGSRSAKNPNLPLSELESARMDGEETLLALLLEATGRSESAIRSALARPIEDATFGRLLSVCGGDAALADRIRPYANLLRTDAWDDPIVYRENAFMVTLGADRRETGTHYTPRSLTESIVETALEPVAYVGPAEGKPREEWRLRSPAELLDMRICDPAMGSGAFLVQACRWLAERLVEAWAAEEDADKFVTVDGNVREDAGEADPMPATPQERLLVAKRLIAERCLYGVDVNPLAVELAKLSIWLVTLAKGRPFGFLDHNLRQGDSLLGIHRLDQLSKLRMGPDDGPYQQRILGQRIVAVVTEAIDIRKRLRTIPIRDIHDVSTMARLDKEARAKLQAVELLADAMIGEALRFNANARALDSALASLALHAEDLLNGNRKIGESIAQQAHTALSIDLPDDKPPRKPFHWPLEFPEVFVRENTGFDAVIGNPPYISFYGRDSQSSKRGKTRYETYAGWYLSAIDGRPAVTGRINTFLLFIVRTVQHSPAARSAFVLPDTIVTNESYSDMRRTLTETGRVKRVVRYSMPVFRSATVGTTILVFGAPLKGGQVELIEVGNEGGAVHVTTHVETCATLAARPLTSWLPIAAETITRATIPHTGTAALADFCYIKDGINPGSKETREWLITETPDGDQSLRLCMEGNWIQPFRITLRNLWVRYHPSRLTQAERKAGASLREAWIFDSPKIVYRQTAPYIIAAVDLNGYCTRNSVHNIVLKKHSDVVLFSLVAYLNSTPFRHYYQAVTGETRKVFPQVHISSMKSMRVPSVLTDPNAQETRELAALARSITTIAPEAHATVQPDDTTEVLDSIDRIVQGLFERLRQHEQECGRQRQQASR